MANKPLTPDMIALTEKKMDLSLDEIIKMSKKTSSKRRRHPRAPVLSVLTFPSGVPPSSSISWIQNRLLDKLITKFLFSSFVELTMVTWVVFYFYFIFFFLYFCLQGVLAQRRSSFHGNQFPVTREVAKSALNRHTHSRAVNWSKPRSAVVPAQKKAAEINLAGKDKAMANQRPQTLDALFKSMKQQRMVDTSVNGHLFPRRRQSQKQNQRGRFGSPPVRIAS